MKIFDVSDRFVLPATSAQLPKIKHAIRALLEFHNADPIEETGDTFSFGIATFMLSSRKKPLHRFSTGQITVAQLSNDEIEVSLAARLSPMNIFGCVGAVVVGLMFSFIILNRPEISPWWALATALAGPVFAYSAIDQSVTRAKAALQEAAALTGRD